VLNSTPVASGVYSGEFLWREQRGEVEIKSNRWADETKNFQEMIYSLQRMFSDAVNYASLSSVLVLHQQALFHLLSQTSVPRYSLAISMIERGTPKRI
jgi:hypothetical protein